MDHGTSPFLLCKWWYWSFFMGCSHSYGNVCDPGTVRPSAILSNSFGFLGCNKRQTGTRPLNNAHRWAKLQKHMLIMWDFWTCFQVYINSSQVIFVVVRAFIRLLYEFRSPFWWKVWAQKMTRSVAFGNLIWLGFFQNLLNLLSGRMVQLQGWCKVARPMVLSTYGTCFF